MENNLLLLSPTCHDPGINAIHNESEIRSMPRNCVVRRMNLDAQRSYYGHIYLRCELESLLAGDFRTGLQIPVRDLELRKFSCFGLSSLPVISNRLLQIF